MNDFVTLLLLLLIIVFTDWVTDPLIRYKAGWGVIGLSSLAIAIHVFLMLRTEFHALRLKLKERKYKQFRREMLKGVETRKTKRGRTIK